MKKIFYFLFFPICAISCSDDNNGQLLPNATIIQVNTTVAYQSPDGVEHIVVQSSPVSNNKLSFLEQELFEDGQSVDVQTDTIYAYYPNGHLKSTKLDNSKTFYFYNGEGNPVGSELNNYQVNFRYVYFPGNVVFKERMFGPYDDPASEVISRFIVQMDDDGNPLNAGPDANLDGVADYQNTLVMTDGNLGSVMLADGSTTTFAFSPIIDTRKFLELNSYGRRLMTIKNAEYLASNDPYVILGKSGSVRILASELGEWDFVALPNNFMQEHTLVYTSDMITYTSTTEYVFE